jgi:type I restriction enzyme S subunit
MSICATIGRPILVGVQACIHDGFVVFRNLSPEVLPRFLYYFLQSKQEDFEGKGQPGTQKNLNIGIVESTPIKLPAPERQKAFADMLDAVDDRVGSEVRGAERLRDLRRALASRLLSGDLRLGGA